MKSKSFQLIMIICLSLIVVSASSILIYTNLTEKIDYLNDKRVPTIVEGTALMVDTQQYFTYNELTTFSTNIELQCNNSDYLEIAIGYKSPDIDLMDASKHEKEVLLWEGDTDKIKSEDMIEQSSKGFIKSQWDLLAKGFTKNEFVKADERIYYLKIIEKRPGPYGYERNITVIQDGEEIIVPDFQPRMNYLKRFELHLNDLVFETQLYPFFDGSQEIIIPIRGVSHELASPQDLITSSETRRKANALINTWSTKPSASDHNWVVVFGTQFYNKTEGQIGGESLGELAFSAVDARNFIMGCEPSQTPDYFKNGLYDYGWNIAFCMDGNSSTTDMKTCEMTDESHFKNMLDFIIDYDNIERVDYLITYITGHGHNAGWPDFQKHKTLTGHTMRRLTYWTDVIALCDYESKYASLTSDGTKILSFIKTCHGNGLESFSSSVHQNNLDSWCFIKKHKSNHDWIPPINYMNYEWARDAQGNPKCEEAIFFYEARNVMGTRVYKIGEEIQDEFNNEWWDDDDKVNMYIQHTASIYFYINWGY
jgi:hypothetical protein